MKKIIAIIISLALLLFGCAKVQVSQDYVENYQFGDHTSYTWNSELLEENSGLLSQDELLADRFKRAIEIVLANQGLQQSDQPDLLVSYVYTVSQMLRSDPINTGYGFGYGRYGRYTTVGINGGSVLRQYQLGMLVIKIYSVRTGHLVWKGIGTREVYTHARPEEISTIVNEMVAAVLKQFPPTH
mgnify:CR=1 FL=1